MDDTALINCIKEHEGSQRYAYSDSLGYITVGIGRCLDRRRGKGLSSQEQTYLLSNDIQECKDELEPLSWYQMQDDVRKCVLIEMCFNMGAANLFAFHKMIASLKDRDYKQATQEMRSSLWASQISRDRLENMCFRMTHGQYP